MDEGLIVGLATIIAEIIGDEENHYYSKLKTKWQS